jgi:class 3 adenylate cyclase
VTLEPISFRYGLQASQCRVLIIDDQVEICALISHYLKADGYQTLQARSGKEARALIARQMPDLVLLDVLMHDTNGFDLCREIKQNKTTALVPVVLITSLDRKEDRIEGIKAGCDEFLSKPVHKDELRARVRSLLELQAAHRALEAERLAHEQQKQAAMRQAFERYVSPKVVEKILADGGQAFMAHNSQRRDAVALFADLRGFTRMSEALTPQQVVGILNRFFSTLTQVAHRHQGTILNMAGDCLLIGFGVPLPLPEPETCAMQTAFEIMRETRALVTAWQAEFNVTLGVGIGLNRGDVIAGNVGSPSYMSYTLIGDSVNVAARLTDLARPGEIICGAALRTCALATAGPGVIEHQFDTALKGKTGLFRAYGYTSA